MDFCLQNSGFSYENPRGTLLFECHRKNTKDLRESLFRGVFLRGDFRALPLNAAWCNLTPPGCESNVNTHK